MFHKLSFRSIGQTSRNSLTLDKDDLSRFALPCMTDDTKLPSFSVEAEFACSGLGIRMFSSKTIVSSAPPFVDFSLHRIFEKIDKMDDVVSLRSKLSGLRFPERLHAKLFSCVASSSFPSISLKRLK